MRYLRFEEHDFHKMLGLIGWDCKTNQSS